MEIKDILKKRRIELGLTQLDVANAVGVSEATVSRWESGDIENMRRSRIAALANALRISPAVIMGWDDDQSYPVAPRTNTLRIAGRDGTLIEKKLSDEQVAALKGIIDQFPEADDDL